MRFLYMKQLEFSAQSDYVWKSWLCVTEVLQSFQIEHHTYIILFFKNSYKTAPKWAGVHEHRDEILWDECPQ